MYAQMGNTAVITPVRIVSYSCHSCRQIEIEMDQWNGSRIADSSLEGLRSKIDFPRKHRVLKDTTAQSMHFASFSLNVESVISWSVDIHRTRYSVNRERGSVIWFFAFSASLLSQAYHRPSAGARASRRKLSWVSGNWIKYCYIDYLAITI